MTVVIALVFSKNVDLGLVSEKTKDDGAIHIRDQIMVLEIVVVTAIVSG